jgi:hypothetical protein
MNHRAVYNYLLTLTTSDESKKGKSVEKKYSISRIAMQWGTDRMFVKRVLDHLNPPGYSKEVPSYTKMPGLDLEKLVSILSSLRLHHKPSNQISSNQIIRAIRLFCNLSPEQVNDLGLPKDQSQLLLHSLEDSINGLEEGVIPEVITKLYNYFITIKPEHQNRENNLTDIQDLRPIVKSTLQQQLGLSDAEIASEDFIEEVERYHIKIQNEICKINFENGFNTLTQFSTLASESNNYRDIDNTKSSCIPRAAIQILTQSLIENELLTEQFPVYLKYIEIKKNRALPLYLDSYGKEHPTSKTGVLNHLHHQRDPFTDTDPRENVMIESKALRNLLSYTVKVHFYIRPPKGYKEYPYLAFDRHPDGDVSLNFFEEVTGIGSPLSHVIAAINRVLLWDIPILNDYIPIAKNLMTENRVLGSSPNSIIWGHNVVCLCKKVAVEGEKQQNKNSGHDFQLQEYAIGNYCGFDLLEVDSKAAFHSRLKAIQQAGINPKEYVDQLLNKIREINALRESEKFLNSYPFSMVAMKETIEKSIFRDDKYRKVTITRKDITFLSTVNSPWSTVAYKAHLAITDAYLKEGRYIAGKKYLDCLGLHIDKFKFCTDLLVIAEYYLSKFRYHYLIDSSGNEGQAKRMLAIAKEHLYQHTQLCSALGELPQSHFYNFYYILSRIHAHEAKIHLFMNRPMTDKDREKKLKDALIAFERSRVYAALGGDLSLFVMWSAYQSWCYIISAYADTTERDNHLNWASVLLDHALVCYSDYGRKCYDSIKANSGKTPESYGMIEIEGIPFIQEIKNHDELKEKDRLYYDHTNPQTDESENPKIGRLLLDQSIFVKPYPPGFGTQAVKETYIYGMPSTILLFALGMRILCENHSVEDQDSERKIRNEIKLAESHFHYSWSIAEEGFGKDKDVEGGDSEKAENQKFIRNFQLEEEGTPKEFSISGLYPHRMTQFADFGKIFAIVCLIILDDHREPENESKINYLLRKIMGEISTAIDLGQERYNTHFKETYSSLRKYFWENHGIGMAPEKPINSNELDEKSLFVTGNSELDEKNFSAAEKIIRRRDKIVYDVFKIITTR